MPAGVLKSLDEIVSDLAQRGTWSLNYVRQTIISRTVNMPAGECFSQDDAYCPDLFFHEDGRYERFDPTIHGQRKMGPRTSGGAG